MGNYPFVGSSSRHKISELLRLSEVTNSMRFTCQIDLYFPNQTVGRSLLSGFLCLLRSTLGPNLS